MKRGELLALARECPQLHTLRASALGESGKFSAGAYTRPPLC
jgi:hypothetical protein